MSPLVEILLLCVWKRHETIAPCDCPRGKGGAKGAEDLARMQHPPEPTHLHDATHDFQPEALLASESDELARIDDHLARTGLSAAADALVKSYRLQYVQLRRQKLSELGPVPRSARDQQVRAWLLGTPVLGFPPPCE